MLSDIWSKWFGGKKRYRSAQSQFERIIVLGPEYDPFTRAVSGWLSGLASKNMVLLKGASASHANMVLTLGAMSGQGLVVIFAGHGDSAALLTDPALGLRADSYGSKHSVLVDSFLLSSIEAVGFFAYSCESARELGDSVAAKNGVFLGYRERIPFAWSSPGEKLDISFKGPLEIVWKAVSAQGFLDSNTFEELLFYYDSQVQALKQGDNKKSRHASLVRMCMREHRKYLVIKGDQDASDVN